MLCSDVSDLLRLPHLPALAALLDASGDGVLFYDADGRIVAASRRAEEILGIPEEQLRGLTPADLAPRCVREDESPFPADDLPAARTLRTGEPQRDVLMGLERPLGERRWVVLNSEPLRTGVPPEMVGVVTVFTDITDRRRAEDDVVRLLALLRREALTDSLTGLANRRAFDERLAAELSRARRHHEPVSLALIDLDDFKALNDRHGHPEGDRALKRVAEIVRASVRAEDTAARLAGDEFAVILPSTAATAAQPVINRVAGAVAGDPLLAGLGTTVSAGVAEAHDEDAAALYSAADAALYTSKRAGGARVSVAE
jgi:diguanylate cyclase (GGDEF)-like protein/PAS domain S-box-containing protein